MAESPSKYKDRALAWSVYCNSKRMDNSYELTYASVCFEVNRIGKATLKFSVDDKQAFDETAFDLFKPGNSIRLEMGDINKQDTLFEGIVLEVGMCMGEGVRSQIIVECRDYAYPATQGRKNRIFQKKKDSDIIREVLSEYGTVQMDSTSCIHPEMVQYGSTDWDFALQRAYANGLFIITQGKKISVFKPKIDASPVLTAVRGKDLIGFDGGLSAAPEEDEVLEMWGANKALKAEQVRHCGNFSFYGVAGVWPGCMIELSGLGARFDGNVFIGSVCHTIENNKWITEAGMGVRFSGITTETNMVSSPASGFLSGIEGLHTGVVKRLEDDPSKEYRILVELPWMDGTNRDLWARFSTLYATNEGGSFFLPEKGDEVLVGFMNQDPNHPVVLGSLYGSKHKPPFDYYWKNDKKALVTRSGMAIEFDEEKKVMTLHTPSKNRIEMDDDGKYIKLSDQHKNEIVMDGNGISLSSAKDMKLTAKGNILLDALQKTEIKAKSDINVNGMNVKLDAKIGFSAKGTATAELSASGQTTVKGAMVMIN